MRFPGLPQLSVQQNTDQSSGLAMVEVVDDKLTAGSRKLIDESHDTISKRFEIGRYIVDQTLNFHNLCIGINANGHFQCVMNE